MTEKNISVYYNFCRSIFQILVIFYIKTATLPPKKVTRQQAPSKNPPPLFFKIWSEPQPLPAKREGVHTMMSRVETKKSTKRIQEES